MATRICSTPIGPLRVQASEYGIQSVIFVDAKTEASLTDDRVPKGVLSEALNQLEAYFAGTLTDFSLPLDPAGTDFQRTVWKALADIPFGRTLSYGDIARSIGQPKGSQAVGLANGRNPIAIIVPCHRVIASDGKLTGYAGGIERKKWLLRHESATLF